MHGYPSNLQPYLEEEGINKKCISWKTTSLSCAIRGHHHCNYEKSHLLSTASFIQNQLQKYNIRDITKWLSPLYLITEINEYELVPTIAVTFILSFDSLFRLIVLQQRAINLRNSIFQDPSTWICQRIEWFRQLEWPAFKSSFYFLLELVSQQRE